MTNTLLTKVWTHLGAAEKKQLAKIVAFHHPGFDPKQPKTFPNMERLLTEIDVNPKLFTSSRPAEGRFTKKKLEAAHDDLLLSVGAWFHELFDDAVKIPWLSEIVRRIQEENAAIVSFNWDLILDHLVFDGRIAAENYGLTKRLGKGPLLLKPHGSLNWYQGTKIDVVSKSKRIEIFHRKDEEKCVHAFKHPPRYQVKVWKTISAAQRGGLERRDCKDQEASDPRRPPR
jgi:hypothetical protein